MVCWCTESLEIKEGSYHDEHGNKTLSLMHIVHCDHMGSKEQVIAEIPLGLTWEEWDKMTTFERIEKVIGVWPQAQELPYVKLLALVKKCAIVLREYKCPYCAS